MQDALQDLCTYAVRVNTYFRKIDIFLTSTGTLGGEKPLCNGNCNGPVYNLLSLVQSLPGLKTD
jgi:hypothetical protein